VALYFGNKQNKRKKNRALIKRENAKEYKTIQNNTRQCDIAKYHDREVRIAM
jgi:hypothetical protein